MVRVGGLTIEVLPKADNHSADENYWRNRLFDMLRVVHDLPLRSPSTAHLRTRPHDILHLYLSMLLDHCERLQRRGLHRAYHGERTNATALSGRLLFAEQIRHNLIHKERFFVARDRFDFDSPLNRILSQALAVASRLNGNRALSARFQQLRERWPELPEASVTEAVFDRLRFPRGTEAYRPAVAIARLILLRHTPTSRGGKDLPALMFNMNRLWEVFLERTLRRHLTDYSVSGQSSTAYFHAVGLNSTNLRPDLTIRYEKSNKIAAILDAKWKLPSNEKPSAGDLQQLYTYGRFLDSPRVGLIYPGMGARSQVQGWFGEEQSKEEGLGCAIFSVPLPEVGEPCGVWMSRIGKSVAKFLVDASSVTIRPKTN